ncbi:MAG: low specificity L-threonine aldolase, partial [Proteobacteria bacterium]|nr:low specificity L-threonine aldolase [Pseudomonadota bacterium]MCA0423790.1 low specificity L-threonine aldolase [Pseudomonadota bacterium]
MNFSSDNVVGASDKVLSAIVAANDGALPSYGNDALTKQVEARFRTLFETDCTIFLVTTGTAANALAISTMVPPYGALLCHRESHVIDDECGAPEFLAGGAKLVGIAGMGAKLTAEGINAHLANEPGGTNHPPFRGVSLSQATECGMVYRPEEIAAIATVAHGAGMAVHMDGARFANALLTLGCTPAEMTWKAGVDVLSFGGTKNGCLMAEAVVFFNAGLAKDFQYRRKRAAQTVSKGRLLAAQFDAYLD